MPDTRSVLELLMVLALLVVVLAGLALMLHLALASHRREVAAAERLTRARDETRYWKGAYEDETEAATELREQYEKVLDQNEGMERKIVHLTGAVKKAREEAEARLAEVGTLREEKAALASMKAVDVKLFVKQSDDRRHVEYTEQGGPLTVQGEVHAAAVVVQRVELRHMAARMEAQPEQVKSGLAQRTLAAAMGELLLPYIEVKAYPHRPGN